MTKSIRTFLSVLAVFSGVTAASPVPAAGVSATITQACPVAGSFLDCTPINGMYAATNSFIVTLVQGPILSEAATMSGAMIKAAASQRQMQGNVITGQWRWWPISERVGEFTYVVVPENGSSITKSVNVR